MDVKSEKEILSKDVGGSLCQAIMSVELDCK